MSTKLATKDIGLRGIRVADTRICLIDGIQGELLFRGYDIHDLANYASYEEVACLLLHGDLPKSSQLDEFSAKLASERELPAEIISVFRKLPKTLALMDVFQSTVALIAGFDPELHDESKEANLHKATRLIAEAPTIIAAWDRIKRIINQSNPTRDCLMPPIFSIC